MNRNNLVIAAVILLLVVGGIIFLLPKTQQQNKEEAKIVQSEILANMKLASSSFINNQNIPPKYTCDGTNVNPPLTINAVPTTAKSLVLIVDDPDAPMGTWVHWTLWNIDPKTSEIAEGSVPTGAVEGKTDFGTTDYSGPCPPSGTHRYFFKLYALDTSLSLSSSAKKEDLERAMSGHILDLAELIGLYSRNK